MSRAFRLTLVAVLSCVLAPKASAQTPVGAARVALAHQVLEASGTVEAMFAGMRANIDAQKLANAQIPAEFWTRFEARMTQDAPQIMDSIAVLYSDRFTQEELQGLLAFHQSPVGRRLRELSPSLVTESSAIGQRWGMRVGAEIGSSLQQKPQ